MVLAVLISAVAGIWLGVSTASVNHGYAAGYGFGSAWVVAGIVLVVGLGCFVFRRTRRAGFILIGAAALVLLGFYATIAVARMLGLVSWR